MNQIIIGFTDELKEVELRYGLGQEYENKSYMTEAIKEFCKMAFMDKKIETVMAETEMEIYHLRRH
jgi:RimJ/RimL family protein N-acetyltransferase